jgi:stage II sporulation protein D
MIILLPLLIVRGCVWKNDKYRYGSKISQLKVYVTQDRKVETMNLEDYVKGVVAAEMPAEFELEALKAQAVAARTYAVARIKKVYSSNDNAHHGADICTDSTHCQAWVSKKGWGHENGNWDKIGKAVEQTAGIIIVYDGNIINPVFHSNSGGRTENAEDVWEGGSVPYLKSVVSIGEDACKEEYQSTVCIGIRDFCGKLKESYPEIKVSEKDMPDKIKVQEYSQGGRIRTVKIGNMTLKGTDVRRVFSLRSTNMKFEKGSDNTIKITTIGYGHGVGMSQWGANNLAKNGESYKEIIKYYYKGVKLAAISSK